jgi:hypothetical protein
MATTDVKWSMTTAEDPFAPIATNHVTLLHGFWAGVDGNGEDTAKEIAAQYLNEDDNWVELFGEDDSATVHLTIHSPVATAGKYEVDVDRAVRSTGARRLDV